MNVRHLIIFLGINAVLAAGLGLRFFLNDEKEKVVAHNTQDYQKSVAVVQQQKPLPDAKPVTLQEKTQPVAQANPNAATQVIKTGPGAVCTVVGPLNLEQKGTMDVILTKNKSEQVIRVEKRPVFEIYWNLGKDKNIAQELFEKQKQNGTMQDPKFILVQDENKDWVVSVVQINTSLEQAQAMANQLAEKAQKINAGGRWQYKAKPEAYFYIFNDYSTLEPQTINGINVMLNPNKQPC